jgi:hypothetical protein
LVITKIYSSIWKADDFWWVSLLLFSKLLEMHLFSTKKKEPTMITKCSQQPYCSQGSSQFNWDDTCCCT